MRARTVRRTVRRYTMAVLAVTFVTLYGLVILPSILWFYIKDVYWETMLDVWSTRTEGE